MKRKLFSIISAVAVVMITVSLMLAVPASAQDQAAAAAPADATMAFRAKRTPDGQPNINGIFTRAGVKALKAQPPSNPIDPSDKNPLSVSNRPEDDLGPYPGILGKEGNVLRGAARVQRRTGIVNPADRNLPWRPDADAKRRQWLMDMNPPKTLQYIELNSRCALPSLFEGEDGNNPYTILQRPGAVVIFYDYNHTSRVIDPNRKEHT